jgi:hypothetical protein
MTWRAHRGVNDGSVFGRALRLAVKLCRDKIASFDQYPFFLPVVRHLAPTDVSVAVVFGRSITLRLARARSACALHVSSPRQLRVAPKLYRILEKNNLDTMSFVSE